VISFENASDHENFLFSNNIFLGSGQMISGINIGSKFLGNVWWSSGSEIKFMEYDSLSAWAKATGQETMKGQIVGIQDNPHLKGPLITDITDPYKLNTLYGYTLLPDSPVKDKGLNIKSIMGIEPPDKDLFGNNVPMGIAVEPGINEIK
jgi:hypothetical protein